MYIKGRKINVTNQIIGGEQNDYEDGESFVILIVDKNRGG